MASRKDEPNGKNIIDDTNKVIGKFDDPKDAAEFVKRWNNFPSMRKFIEAHADNGDITAMTIVGILKKYDRIGREDKG